MWSDSRHQLLESGDDNLECEVDVLDSQSNSATSVLSPSASSRAALAFAPFRAAAQRTRRGPYMPPLLRGAVKPRPRENGSREEDSPETPVPLEASQAPPATWASALGRIVPLSLVDPRSDPKVHSIVAEKQLPTELLDQQASWVWMEDVDAVHDLEIFTEGAASLNDVWPRTVRLAGWCAVFLSQTLQGVALVGVMYGPVVSDPGRHAYVGVSRLSSNAAELNALMLAVRGPRSWRS